MLKYIFLSAVFSLLFIGYFSTNLEPIKVTITDNNIDFLRDVKPILDKRCVTCHSCFDSPCQAKFSSYDGIDRGGSKEKVYLAKRLFSQKPTRLFIDAKSTDEWREKKFFSLTEDESENGYVNSIMGHMLYDKRQSPDIIGDYEPDHDKLVCAENLEELKKYQNKHPNHGMPYGFPALQNSEYELIMQWLAQGAKGPSDIEQKKIEKPSSLAQAEIDRWEMFLNLPDAKHQMSARYIYEHFFISHINFRSAPNEFYQLIRSSTPAPQRPDTLKTLRPYDKPEVDKFYYRFEKIYSTIVHKTHLVSVFDDDELQRIKELFIETPWLEKPHVMDYKKENSSNPFIIYAQIPPSVRYQFLLEHNEFITRTFIRGPICKGNIALSVIRDHFWLLFQDPAYDVGVLHPEFLIEQSQNLRTPVEQGSYNKVTKTFSDSYNKKYKRYYDAKIKMIAKQSPKGRPIESIWKGVKATDAPILTVYRHYDSASLYRGPVGELPSTIWVIDYAQFERIFYTLVAGFDVFGNVSHQLNVRRYMDFFRMEGELNYITYLPKTKRAEIFSSWYSGDAIADEIKKNAGYTKEIGTVFDFKTDDPKRELFEHLIDSHFIKETNMHFDKINYFKEGEKRPSLMQSYKDEDDLQKGFRALTSPGTGFIKHMVDGGVNVAYLRVKWKNGKYSTSSFVVNRWHDNVNSLNAEKKRLDPSKDTLDILSMSVGSYPNVFFDVNEEDLPDFFDMVKNFRKNNIYYAKAKKYAISRANKDFWEYFDWFQQRYYEDDPLNSGIYDLNRYYKMSW